MIWNILKIKPTKDIKEIKKAYAKLAKQFNPEEHPEEFKKIYDAYKAACRYAKSEIHPFHGVQSEMAQKTSENSDKSSACSHEYVFDFSSVNDTEDAAENNDPPYIYTDELGNLHISDQTS